MHMVGIDTAYQSLFIQGWCIEAYVANMDACCV